MRDSLTKKTKVGKDRSTIFREGMVFESDGFEFPTLSVLALNQCALSDLITVPSQNIVDLSFPSLVFLVKLSLKFYLINLKVSSTMSRG